MTYLDTGYTETALLWNQVDGSLSPTIKPAPHEACTFRVHWGLDRHIGLPTGLRADVANRYINALEPIVVRLAEFATKEYIPTDFYGGADGYALVYSDGYEPYMRALEQIIDSDHDRHDFGLRLQAENDLGMDPGYYTPSEAVVESRMRQIETDRIRDLIVDGDADYTTAQPGARYTLIRMDNKTGHLSAHTRPADQGENVTEWQVSPLSSRQANQVMRKIGSDALRLAHPTAPGVIVSDARQRLETVLARFLIGEDQVSEHLDEQGLKDTPAHRAKALRSLLHTRAQRR
ncbi:hypothetical protein [Nocardiopsis sp. JB363]|uniref:hypothetical protein n=1 Tax=Nocardiopsis sp. JB363 TaxID=1434837 RepID=UPI00097AA2B5|nr:hypothetical protein [Nocardiopsis sp. JB363]SIO86461.1 hypothetical protein BQ8420_12120 [Nocardiopsis sp. JB363]